MDNRYYYRILRNEYIYFKKRNKNIHIEVFETMVDGRFHYIGERYADSASWMGDKALVSEILAEKKGYTLSDNGYKLKEDVSIIELP